MTRAITPDSAALTARIVELRSADMKWNAVAYRVGMSASACRDRYYRQDVQTLLLENARLRAALATVKKALEGLG